MARRDSKHGRQRAGVLSRVTPALRARLHLQWVGLALLACLILAPTSGAAQDVSAAQRDALEQRIETFSGVFEDGVQPADFDLVWAFMPPAILKNMAAGLDLTEGELQDAAADAMTQVFESLGWPEMRFDMGFDTAVFGRSDAGRPYAVMSTRSEIEGIGSGVSPTVAVLENDIWYIVRLEQPAHYKAFYEAYPDLAGIDIPEGSFDVAE